MIANIRTDRSNHNGAGEESLQSMKAEISDAYSESCGCRTCETVVSPAAYLADLIDYTLNHLKKSGTPITLEELENEFHQPIGELPTACEEVEKQVQQVRICIEVLRRYLIAKNLPAPGSPKKVKLQKDYRHYLETAYTTILGFVGTSFEELREVLLSEDNEAKGNLALRISIPSGDQLTKLLLDFDSLTNPEIERELEHLFGLVDTSRDPLSEGAKFGDDDNQLVRWNLDGVVWNKNTDADGYVYLTLSRPDTNVFRVEAFKDQNRSQLIAQGETDTSDGLINLTPATIEGEEDIARSGFQGFVRLEFTAENQDIKISAVPLFLSLRLQFLYALWQSLGTSDDPIIDPDLVSLAHLQTPLEENAAFLIWKVRQTAITERLELLRNLEADASDPERFTALLAEANVALTEDELTPEELGYLLKIQDIINQPEPIPILDLEWENVISILVQVEKERQRQNWINEESDKNILLSPDFFKLPDSFDEQRRKLPEWRANLANLRDFENTIKNRTEERQEVVNNFTKVFNTTEDETLHLLRDALIAASDAGGTDLAAKAQWVTENLLINAQMDNCLHTTRIAQAIETLQVLLFSIRTGQLNDTHPELELYSDDFDEEWKWIGSYNTWRAAMMVFLFPENVLDPTLRRLQTNGFVNLVEALRNKTRLTPDDACKEARKYADYINDIPVLRIEATCEARVPLTEEECPAQVTQGTGYLTYLFARAVDTGNVYMSTYRPGVGTGFEQSFWEPISLLGSVLNIVGASVYEFESDRSYRYIYLFARKKEDIQEKLVFIRYNLETRKVEEGGTHELKLPEEGLTFTAVINQRNYSSIPPELVLRLDGEDKIYFKRLNRDGNSWDSAPEFNTDTSGSLNLLAMFSFDIGFEKQYPGHHYFLLIGNYGERICFERYKQTIIDDEGNLAYRKVRDGQSGFIAYGEWKGAFFWPSISNVVYTFWKQNEQLKYKALYYSLEHTAIFLEPTELFEELGTIPGLIELESMAVHTGAHTEPSLYKQHAYQLSGDKKGSFLGFFTRDISSTGLNLVALDDSQPGHTILANRNPGGQTPDILFLLNTGAGRLFGNDGMIFDPGDIFPPLPPIPPPPEPENLLIFEIHHIRLAPLLTEPVEIIQKLTENELQVRKAKIEAAFQDNTDSIRSNIVYLEEAFYFVPLLLALNLQRRGHYIDALDWHRTVFDYTQPRGLRKIYFGLTKEESLPWNYERYAEWLLEPLNPHAIAATRQNTYTRFTLLTLVQCFLDFADAEFARDTSETVARAHSLYMTALEFLDLPDLKQNLGKCESIVDEFDHEIVDLFEDAPQFVIDGWTTVVDRFDQIKNPEVVGTTIDEVRAQISGEGSILDRLERASRIVNDALYREPFGSDFRASRDIGERNLLQVQRALLSHPAIATTLEKVSFAVGMDFDYTFTNLTGHRQSDLPGFNLPWLGETGKDVHIENPIVSGVDEKTVNHFETLNLIAQSAPLQVFYDNQKFPITYFTSPGESFCVPPNPLIESLRSHAKLNLEKIRSCRNIAGLERPLAPYSTAIRVDKDVPFLNRRGELILPTALQLPPTLYRYRTLIERAKHLVSLAQQLEATFLSILQMRDAAYYNLLKARQDINLSLAGVRLRQLGMVEARDNVRLSELQIERAQIQEQHYQSLVDEQEGSRVLESLISAATGAALIGAGIIAKQPTIIVEGASTLIGLFTGTDADQRRRELEQAMKLARQDVQISDQQNRLARDRLRIVGQELRIANLQTDHARETLDFLVNKFTNAELYDWMSVVLEEVYSTFLQQATAVAQLAAIQLAFERQEPIPNFIQADYWEAPLSFAASLTDDSDSRDRRGLTGSARLLQDVFQLDQFAFDTEQRKQELTKSISLARMAPAEFQRFRDTGLMNFNTPMELFDRDFPGHYLRLIKRMRVSVIALIPPTEGIKATLASSGISRVVTRGETFRETTIARQPETIALTSAIDASGQFEFQLRQDNELLRPFEGNGVATDWTFELPKAANRFEFHTIADVLLTIDYTALFSREYRNQVIERLGRFFSADRSFSFRHELSDQWFDLNNPEQTATPMTVRFTTRREDFSPNLNNLQIQHVVLFFSRAEGQLFEVKVSHLQFTEEDGTTLISGEETSTDGVISTRGGKAASWLQMIGKSPFGEWELALPNTEDMQNRFKDEEIEDILFVITYQGETPEWPS